MVTVEGGAVQYPGQGAAGPQGHRDQAQGSPRDCQEKGGGATASFITFICLI